jgi:uncharacterized membrane protein
MFVLCSFVHVPIVRALIKSATVAAVIATIGLAYLSLYVLRDVCLVCMSMYIISFVMVTAAFKPHAKKEKAT